MKAKLTDRVYNAVPLQEAKLFLREDREINDTLIESLLKTAENVITTYTGYCISESTFEVSLSEFTDITLPYGPLVEGSVMVTYNTSQTLPSDKFKIVEGEVRFKEDLPEAESVTVEFKCGGEVSEDLKTAIKLLTLIYYERNIPADERENMNPLKMDLLRHLITPVKTKHFF